MQHAARVIENRINSLRAARRVLPSVEVKNGCRQFHEKLPDAPGRSRSAAGKPETTGIQETAMRGESLPSGIC